MILSIIDKELGDDSITKNSNNNKSIKGGLSIETFFTLAPALCTMAECIKHLLDKKNQRDVTRQIE